MKTAILNKKLLSSLVIALVLTACKSAPLVDKPAAVEDKSPAVAAKVEPVAPAPSADTSGVKEVAVDGNALSDSSNPLKDPKNILSKRNIYFDFDSDTVKAEYRPLIEAHAQYLLANGNAKMMLQGNTDERGTREYNLSLGQRRSVAVKKSFNALGVQDKQIETVSFGEEKASTNCADEPCHQANRRVDVAYEKE